MIINRSEASRRLNISRQAMDKMTKKNPLPGYLVKVNGVLKVDTENPEWLMKVEKKKFINKTTNGKKSPVSVQVAGVKQEKKTVKKKVRKLLKLVRRVMNPLVIYQKMMLN